MPPEGVKILIIDDEEDFSFFVKKNLERIEHYEVITAAEGKGGVEKAMQYEPDLILLDIMMPGISGFEVLRRLKSDEKTRAIPVIMLTGKDDDESKIKAAGLHNEDYIVKPAGAEELRSRIEKALKGRKTKRA